MSKAERDARYLKNRRRLRLCIRGGCRERTGDAARCAVHAEEHAEQERERRSARKAQKAAA